MNWRSSGGNDGDDAIIGLGIESPCMAEVEMDGRLFGQWRADGKHVPTKSDRTVETLTAEQQRE